jgi:type IV secretory pathway VirJ component
LGVKFGMLPRDEGSLGARSLAQAFAPFRFIRVRRLFAAAAIALFAAMACASRVQAVTFPKPDREGTVEVQAGKHARTLVLFLSGDGGWWGDIDAQLADRLAAKGYAVVGLDTNVWFAKTRTVDEITSHVSQLVSHYTARAKAAKVALIGYSYGADVLPLAINRLNQALSRKIAAIVLIAPARRTTLQVTLLERTDLVRGNIDLALEFAKLPKRATVCIYGKNEEDETGCTLPAMQGAQLIGLPGGHHFGNNVAMLGDRLLSAVNTRARP